MATTPRLQGTGYSSQLGLSPDAASAAATSADAFRRALAAMPVADQIKVCIQEFTMQDMVLSLSGKVRTSALQ